MATPAKIIVTTPEDLEETIERVVRKVLESTPAPPAVAPAAKPLTDEDLAKARKSVRRFGRGT